MALRRFPITAPRPADLLRSGVAGAGLLGLLVGRLTLHLNLHLFECPTDPILLLVYFGVGYGLAGLALGLVGAAGLAILSRLGLRGWPLRAAGVAGVSGLLIGPLLYYALLPDVGWQHGFLSGLIFGASRLYQVASLAGLALGLALLGLVMAPLVQRLAARLGRPAGRLLGGLWTLAGAVTIGLAIFFHPRPPVLPTIAPETLQQIRPLEPNAPLVLLCVDGADLDDMILPMVEKGELPTYARLMKEATWGPLKSFEPTLSAVVWTSIITGKTAEGHGIRHFIVFKLPGLHRAIHQFPRHTGLNFRVFPWLERLPGMPPVQAPYTSNMRQAEALWNIAGRYFPVGAYRWLVTWPTEPVNGFNVAGGVGWLQIMGGFEKEAGAMLKQGFHYPQDVYAGLPPPEVPADVTREMLAPYVGPGHDVSPNDWRIKAIAAGLRDPTGHYLPLLIDKFHARFTAAAFFQVDEFCHYFTAFRNKGGIYSDAVAERYRFHDARLGEFLAAMGDSVNVIVVSDHGYDFVNNHHTNSPAGIFFARGPAFAAGRRLDTLDIYDVAPLCLHLLGLPVGQDMPGGPRGNWLEAVRPEWRRPIPMIATWETGERRKNVNPVASPIDEQIKEQLRSLGYIN